MREQRHFNSRPRKEVDGENIIQVRKEQHFNSRPRKEVDRCLWRESTTSSVFQLTTSQGGRLLSEQRCLYCTCHFNSRPRKEVDVQQGTGYNKEKISTHDLARRSTAIFTQKVFLSKSLFVLIAYNIFILY